MPVAPSLQEYRDNHPELQLAKKRWEAVMKAAGDGNRWGETRRFQGRAAANRISRADSAKRTYFRVWDQVTREYDRRFGTNHAAPKE